MSFPYPWCQDAADGLRKTFRVAGTRMRVEAVIRLAAIDEFTYLSRYGYRKRRASRGRRKVSG